MIWKVPPVWKGQTAFILAGGPSLRGLDATQLAGRRVITINDSWRLFPVGSVNYFCDEAWWNSQIASRPWSTQMERSFHDQIYKGHWATIAPAFKDHPQVGCLQNTGQRGLETDPSGLRNGSNSGYQAINLAYHLGASRIVLLGYDMKCRGARTHWHDEERVSSVGFESTLRHSFLPHFETLVEPLADAGVEVVNATPDSALTCWPRAALADVLNGQLSLF